MRLKTEFITNSSCASFTILKHYLSPHQIELIYDHINESNNYIVHRGPQREIFNGPGSQWNIVETETSIEGNTSMDNFDMTWFLLQIGVDEDHIEMRGCYGD